MSSEERMIIESLPPLESHNDGIIMPAQRATSDDKSKLTPSIEFVGGVYTANGQHVSLSRMERGNGTVQIVGGFDIDPPECEYVDDVVIFGGFLYRNHFGHFIAETMARTWLDGLPVVFISHSPSADMSAFNRDILAAAGVKMHRNPIVWEPTRFKRVIVPGPSMGIANDNIYRVSAMLGSRVSSYFAADPANAGRRVYLTRAALQRGVVHGEKIVEQAFREDGYEVVAPETLSIGDQVRLVNSADVVVGCVGSAMHNLLFTAKPKNAVYIERTKNTAHTLKLFKNIDGLIGHNGVYLNHSSNDLNTFGQHGPFKLDVQPLLDDLFSRGFFTMRHTASVSQNQVDTEYRADWNRQHGHKVV